MSSIFLYLVDNGKIAIGISLHTKLFHMFIADFLIWRLVINFGWPLGWSIELMRWDPTAKRYEPIRKL